MKRFALTAKQVETVKATCGKTQLTDGQGLYLKLFFDRPGHSWRFDYTRPNGKRNTLVLGSSDTLSLADARTKAQDARELLAKGIDPAEQRDAARSEQRAVVLADAVAVERAAKNLAPAGTMRAVCEDYHASKVAKGHWNEDGHAKQWLGTLKLHAFDALGMKKPDDIEADWLLDAIIGPLEKAGMHPTARNVCKFLAEAFDVAMFKKLGKSNPAQAAKRWMDKNAVGGNNPAVTTAAELRTVLLAIREWPTTVTRAALMAQAALFQRPGNTCAMRWPHLDLDAGLWVIPAAEMKGKKARKEKGADHVVPLPKQVVELIRSLKPLTGRSKYVFESPNNPGLPITNDTLTNALRNMGFGEKQTAHGFRATARTMLSEAPLKQRGAVIEAQLAHVSGSEDKEGYIVRCDPLGPAYNRATHLDERREMVQLWADYLDELLTQEQPAPVELVQPEPLLLAA